MDQLFQGFLSCRQRKSRPLRYQMEQYGARCALDGSVTHTLFQPRVTGVIGAETLSGQDRWIQSPEEPRCVQRAHILTVLDRRKDGFPWIGCLLSKRAENQERTRDEETGIFTQSAEFSMSLNSSIACNIACLLNCAFSGKPLVRNRDTR